MRLETAHKANVLNVGSFREIFGYGKPVCLSAPVARVGIGARGARRREILNEEIR